MTTVRLQHPALLTGTRSASWTPVLAISPLGSHAPFRVEFRWTCRRSSQRQLPLSRYRTHRTLLRRRRHPGSLDIRAPWFVGGPCCSAAGPPPSCPCSSGETAGDRDADGRDVCGNVTREVGSVAAVLAVDTRYYSSAAAWTTHNSAQQQPLLRTDVKLLTSTRKYAKTTFQNKRPNFL